MTISFKKKKFTTLDGKATDSELSQLLANAIYNAPSANSVIRIGMIAVDFYKNAEADLSIEEWGAVKIIVESSNYLTVGSKAQILTIMEEQKQKADKKK